MVTITSFFTDISSEMIFNLVLLFLANVLNTGTAVIGLIDGVTKALIANWVPDERRGTAYGLHNATIRLMALPASAALGLLMLVAHTPPSPLLPVFCEQP